MKLSKKFEPWVFVFVMVFGMTSIVTALSIFINLGFPQDFFLIWIKTWSTTFLLAFFPAYFMRAVAIKVVKKVIHN